MNVHILIVASWYPSINNPIKGIFIKRQVEALRKNGIEVGVVHVDLQNKGEVNNQGDTEREVGASDPRLFQQKQINRLTFVPGGTALTLTLAGKKLAKRYIEQFGLPDLIHAHATLYAGVLGRSLKKDLKLPLMLTEHSSRMIVGDLAPWHKILSKKVFMSSDLNLAVSRFLMNGILRRFNLEKNNWDVLPNIIGEEFETIFMSDTPSDNFRFLSIGHLRSIKGFDVLLKAFAMARKSLPEGTKLTIAGWGQEETSLKNLCVKLNLSKDVTFLTDNRISALELMDNHNVVISSSRTETFGVTLIEAMARGRPVIATRSGGPEEFINPETGILVPRDNPDELAKAMVTMYGRYNKYDFKAIRKYALDHFGERVVISRLIKFYDILLNG